MGGSPGTNKSPAERKGVWRVCLAAAAAAGLAACAELKPVPLPTPKDVVETPAAFAGQTAPGSRMADSLLGLIDEPALTAAAERALAGNLDLRLAAKRLKLAGVDLTLADAGAWPRLSGNASANRSRGAESLSPTLDAQWELDLWGRQAALRQAARADHAAAAARQDAMRASIAAQFMQAWFDAVSAKGQQRLEAGRLQVLRETEKQTLASYRSGFGSLDDLSAIERDVALSEAALAQLEGQTREAVRAIQLLSGQYPDNSLPLPAHLPRLKAAPAAGVPLAVLAARPDMQAAWQDAAAANRRIAVSQKELLPQVTLTGQFGAATSDFSALSHGATIWSLAAALTVPLFEAGRRRANIEASRNKADQALLTYLQTALTAFAEVERGLDQEQFLSRREVRLAAAVKHARAAEGTMATRYRAGLAGILDLLSTRNAVFDIQSQLLAVRNERLKNRVALGLALGTGV